MLRFQRNQFEGFMMNPAPKAPDSSTYSGRFAARLRMLREKAGLSVDEAVQQFEVNGYKVTAKTLYNWESAMREPPFDALPAIAATYKLRSVRSVLPEK